MCKNCNCPKDELGPWWSISSALWVREDSVEDPTVTSEQLVTASSSLSLSLSLSPCAAQDKATSALHEKILPMLRLELKLSCLVALCSSHSVLILAWTAGIPSFPKSTGERHLPLQLLDPTWPSSSRFQPESSKMDLGNLPTITVCSWQRSREAVASSTQAVKGNKDPLSVCMACASTLGSVTIFSPWTARGL